MPTDGYWSNGRNGNTAEPGAAKRRLIMLTGTIVAATVIGALSSTGNAGKARDPEMHQTRKGQQWFSGMKLHIGVDSRTGRAHRALVMAANVHGQAPAAPTAAWQRAARVWRQRLLWRHARGALLFRRLPEQPGRRQPERCERQRHRPGQPRPAGQRDHRDQDLGHGHRQ